MGRQVFRWQLRDETGAVVNNGTCFAWNAAIHATEGALRDIPGRGMFERDGAATVQHPDPHWHHIGDMYEQRWSGPRGTFTAKVVFGLAIT